MPTAFSYFFSFYFNFLFFFSRVAFLRWESCSIRVRTSEPRPARPSGRGAGLTRIYGLLWPRVGTAAPLSGTVRETNVCACTRRKAVSEGLPRRGVFVLSTSSVCFFYLAFGRCSRTEPEIKASSRREHRVGKS